MANCLGTHLCAHGIDKANSIQPQTPDGRKLPKMSFRVGNNQAGELQYFKGNSEKIRIGETM